MLRSVMNWLNPVFSFVSANKKNAFTSIIEKAGNDKQL
jgi:hypothetical protein